VNASRSSEEKETCYDAGKSMLAGALALVTRRAIGGRKGVFRDYRLRVAAVVGDYEISERRKQAPADGRAMYDVSEK
jgi:hypothetical protein